VLKHSYSPAGPATDSGPPAVPSEVLAAVRRIQLRASRAVDDVLAGQYRSTFRGMGMEFEEVRPYAPGDDIRSIDWNVTARTGQPFVKRYVEERELTVFLVVDVSASGRFGSHKQSKGEVAAELTALLSLAAISNDDKVGLLLVSDQVERFVPAKKGKKHVLRVIREVLSSRPVHRGTALAEGVAYLSRVARRHATVFLISDFLTDTSPDGPLARALRVARRRHDVVAVSIRDRREERLPSAGLIELEDLETGAVRLVDSSSAAVRAAFEKKADRRSTERAELLRRMGVDEVPVEVTGDWVEALVRFFRRRGKRARRRSGG